MTLKERITEDMKAAMRARDGARLSAIREAVISLLGVGGCRGHGDLSVRDAGDEDRCGECRASHERFVRSGAKNMRPAAPCNDRIMVFEAVPSWNCKRLREHLSKR